MHEGQIEGMYEAFADLVIVHVQPLGSSHSENLGPRRGGYSQQCIYWENDATSWRALDCDRGAREPETVRELCTSYLPRNWALVVQVSQLQRVPLIAQRGIKYIVLLC